QTDAIARFHRLLGKDVYFQTGTDEHGIKNWQTAEKAGKEIHVFLDENVGVFKDLYQKLNISFDNFIRTTDSERHHPGAIQLWKRLVASGDIYKKKYRGMYCSGCEAFKTEKELENGKCPDHPTREITQVEEENYFFRLSRYRDQLKNILKKDEYRIVPEIRKNEILSFLDEVRDISFSRPRSSLNWGIPVPDDPDHIMYVWCDALSNYITGIGYGRDEDRFNELWPADIHVIGKDILRFHAAFWPAMLLSAELPLPKELFVHGFILSGGAKMGKSTGNVIEPSEQIEKFGVDPFRYAILQATPLQGDGEYAENLIKERINIDLVGNFSNFCYRSLSFTAKNYDSKITGIDRDDVIDNITERFRGIKEAYESYDLKKAVAEIFAVSDMGNKYLQRKEPWKNKETSGDVLGTCINILKNLAIFIEPVMPGIAARLRSQLNLTPLSWNDLGFDLKNHTIGSPEILVKRIE
ncbi:MAG: methionine--tRNA ligase, partial [Spirochaetales bacterium]|nr:methionine--tRNA ligase [Spirochaetales bacterium]